MDSFDRGRRALALLAIVALIALVVALSFSDRTAKPMAINGDMLGQETSESIDAYAARAGTSLAEAPAGEKAYALVSFARPLNAEAAAAVLDGIGRVNAMVMLSAPAMALPEPIAGESRADVFQRQITLVDAQLAGIGNVRAPQELNGVVVWDTPEAVKKIAENPEVFSVEILPPDAAWGAFGVRPVNVDGTPLDGA
ncbi:hypothetical protein SFC07_01685 [Corynebacterium callunae]|uniref:hypothetical protein n=1 Tax=Corynebacterium callunae TaxID=1721 RepID=UPI0039819FB9